MDRTIDKYFEMYNSIPWKIQIIKDYCKAKQITIYKDIVFISVADEKKGTYFVDYEYSSPRTRYARVYSYNFTEADFEKLKKQTTIN